MKQYVYTKSVDYLKQNQKRKKLATYLRAGNFRKIAGKKNFNSKIMLRRTVLEAAAIIIILTGIYFTIF